MAFPIYTNVVGVRYEGGEYVQAVRSSSTTINLVVGETSVSTGTAIVSGAYLVTTTTHTRINFSDLTGVANQTHQLLSPGERVMVIDNKFLNVIKAEGFSDGLLSITKIE